MKKIMLGLGVLLVLLGGFLSMRYYQDTYKGQEYYVKVPTNVDTSLEKWKSGKYTITGRRYEFVGINKQGQERTLNITITDDSKNITEADLLQAGQYLVITASKNRVINYKVINQNDVPANILNNLN